MADSMANLAVACLRRLLRIPVGLCLLAACPLLQADPEVSLEYQLKAALIYKLTKFVSWPEQALPQSDDPIILCVYGDNPFGGSLERVAERKVHGRPIELNPAITASEAHVCQVIFFNPTSRADSLKLIESIKHKPILTISDSPYFAKNGGMIEITQRDRRLAFSINAGAARRAGLQLAAPLLELAIIVGEDL